MGRVLRHLLSTPYHNCYTSHLKEYRNTIAVLSYLKSSDRFKSLKILFMSLSISLSHLKLSYNHVICLKHLALGGQASGGLKAFFE